MKAKIHPKSTIELAEALIQAWRQIAKSPGPSDYLLSREFGLCHSCVSEGMTALKEGTSWAALYRRAPMLGAYMSYFWPAHYAQALAVFSKFAKPLARVLDLGSGPGPFTLAALELQAKEVVAADASERALMVLSEFIARLGHTVSVREWVFPKKLAVDGLFDTVILGHSFLEMTAFNPEKGVELIAYVSGLMQASGKLLIVEYNEAKQRKALGELQKTLLEHPKLMGKVQGSLHSLSVPVEKTRLMQDLARAIKRPALKNELLVFTLTKV